MLKKETLEQLKALKLDPEKLIEAIKDEKEVDFAVPKVVVFTDAELTQRDAVKIDEGKKTGETEAKKVFVGELGKKLGIDGLKEDARIGDLVKEVQGKINASNDDKVKELQEQVTRLTKDKEGWESEKNGLISEKEAIRFDFELISYFEPNRGADLTDSDRLMLLKNKIKFDTVDGKKVAKDALTGDIIRDPKTQAPLPIKDVVAGKFKEMPILMGATSNNGASGQGGRGVGNSGAGANGGVKTLSQAKEAWKALDPEKNVNTVSPEFTDYVNKLAQADTTFDMYK